MHARTQYYAAVSRALAVGALVSFAPLPALGGEAMTTTAADAVAFKPGPPTLPAGAQVAVLYGSPAADGPFALRLKFPAGFSVPPHFHSKDEVVTVISGALGISHGETLDRTAADMLEPGGFVAIPAGTAHFAWTETETVVQLNGLGPFDIEYVDKANDPRIN